MTRSARPVDLVVTELAVIAFPGGRATLLETAPGVTAEQVLAATEAEIAVSDGVKPMSIRYKPDRAERSPNGFAATYPGDRGDAKRSASSARRLLRASG